MQELWKGAMKWHIYKRTFPGLIIKAEIRYAWLQSLTDRYFGDKARVRVEVGSLTSNQAISCYLVRGDKACTWNAVFNLAFRNGKKQNG